MKFPITFQEPQLPTIAGELAHELAGGDVVLLSGELGAGKTTFTKALATALGVQTTVTSPTFTLMNVYPVSGHPTIHELVHVDTYRIERSEELEEIGLAEYLGRPDTLCVIEWPEKILDIPARARVWRLHITGEGTMRSVTQTI